MRGLARQYLPTSELREADQAIAALLQLRCRAVESLRGKADFVRSLVWYANAEISVRKALQGFRQFDDRAAEARRNQPDEGQCHQPDGSGEKCPCRERPAPQNTERIHGPPGL